MSERKKLEISEINKPMVLELLFDSPVTGQSKFGDYFLYAVRNGDGTTEYSYFAPPEVHEQLKGLKKGSKVIITKLAEQKNSKIVIRYDIKVKETEIPLIDKTSPVTNGNDNFYELMLQSCKDAVRIQNELGGLMDAKSLAVTLFIARSKVGYGG